MKEIEQIAQQLKTTSAARINTLEWRQLLIKNLQWLLKNNLPGLWQLLYRLDVSEATIQAALQQLPNMPAEELIADAIIMRLTKTLESRKNISTPRPDPSSEDAW